MYRKQKKLLRKMNFVKNPSDAQGVPDLRLERKFGTFLTFHTASYYALNRQYIKIQASEHDKITHNVGKLSCGNINKEI